VAATASRADRSTGDHERLPSTVSAGRCSHPRGVDIGVRHPTRCRRLGGWAGRVGEPGQRVSRVGRSAEGARPAAVQPPAVQFPVSRGAQSVAVPARACKLGKPGRGNPGPQFSPLRAAFCREAFRGPAPSSRGELGPRGELGAPENAALQN
jgi:hypothetical protein